MAALSNYLENKIIDHFLRNQTFTPPTAVYVALFTSGDGLETNAPTTEVSGNAYERVQLTLGTPVAGTASNSVEVLFPDATGGSWGILTHVAIVDHPSNENWSFDVNILMYAALAVPKTVGDGDSFKIPVNLLNINLD